MFNNGIGNKNMKMKHVLHSLKRKYKDFLLDKIALPIIRNEAKESRYISHYKREMEFARNGKRAEGMDALMDEQVCDLLALLSTQGDSGFSIGFKKHYFTKAMMFETLSPLTFKDDEFGDDYGGSALQNKRDSSVFKDKNSGRIYDIDAFSHRQVFSYNIDTDEMKKSNGLTWSGSIMVYDDIHGKGWFGVSNGYIDPKNKNFTADNKAIVPTIEVIDNTCDRGSFIMSITRLSAFPKAFFKDYTLIASDKEWAKKDTDLIMSNRRLEIKLLNALEKLPKEDEK